MLVGSLSVALSRLLLLFLLKLLLSDRILALDVLEEVLLAAEEKTVLEALVVGAIPCLVEVVHVELADEARKVIMLEVLRQDLVGELVHLLYYETVSLSVPADDVVDLGVINDVVGL